MGKVWIYWLLFVCVFCLFLFVCTVTDFSAEDKTSSIKFRKAVRRRLKQESPIFVNIAPQKPKFRRIRAWPACLPIRPIQMWCSWNIARRVKTTNLLVTFCCILSHFIDCFYCPFRSACGRGKTHFTWLHKLWHLHMRWTYTTFIVDV